VKTRFYQIALFVAMIACLALAGALVYVWRGSHPAAAQPSAEDPVIARGPASGSAPASRPAESAEPALTPIQLSPQRMQQIGVTTAVSAYKNVTQQINAPGNVDINEQRLATVQTRFAGWIQTVDANATFQYVHKGQTLLTIYSPELVSSQQEYLLARKNQASFDHDAHSMAAHGGSMAARESGWLLNAAEERIRQFGVPAATLEAAVIEGAVQRLRPKLMTVGAVILSLAPILWETGIGSDVMKPIAAPIVGGMITSTIHVLILVPVFFLLIKRRAVVRHNAYETTEQRDRISM